MSNILVTGVAGFIGAKVAEFLLADDHEVIGVDNLNDAYDVRLKKWRLAQLEGKPGFEFQKIDICDRPSLRAVFSRPDRLDRPNRPDRPYDAVINLAARAGVRQSVENPWIYFDTNVTGTLNLLELCREFDVKKFVLASTSSLYGGDSPQPFCEDAMTNRPLSPYAASKKAAEVLCYTYHYLHRLDVTVLRYFTVYGPAGRPDMIPFRLVQWISEGRPVTIYGDGKQSRDFTYIDDIARGTMAGLKPLGYEVINLGSDEPIILNDAIQLIERIVNCEAKINFLARHRADVMVTWADIGKAKRLLDWDIQTDFKEGISQLICWYQENRNWAENIQSEHIGGGL